MTIRSRRRNGPRVAALALLLGFVLPPSGLAAVLTVSTTSDTINGCVTSPDCLIGTPGGDGISLREAITAVNAAPGPHVINFAATLAGQTISLTSRLPAITRDVISILGPTTAGGAPTLTIDPGNVGDG